MISVDAFCECLSEVETLLSKAQSLLFRFPGRYDLVDRLLRITEFPRSKYDNHQNSNHDTAHDIYMRGAEENKMITQSEENACKSATLYVEDEERKPKGTGFGNWREGGIGVTDLPDRQAIFSFLGAQQDIVDGIKRSSTDVPGTGSEAKEEYGPAARGSDAVGSFPEAVRPTEREYVLRSVVEQSYRHIHSSLPSSSSSYSSRDLGSKMVTMRMGCCVHETEAFPQPMRSLRVSMGFEQSEFR